MTLQELTKNIFFKKKHICLTIEHSRGDKNNHKSIESIIKLM